MKARIIFFIIYLFIVLTSRSQIIVNFTRPVNNINDIFYITINNLNQKKLTIYITINITDKERAKILVYRTLNINLPPGITNIDRASLGNPEIKYYNNNFRKYINTYKSFPEGTYEISINVHNPVDNAVLSKNSIKLKIKENQGEDNKKSDLVDKNSFLKFTGYSDISVYYTDYQRDYQNIPQFYIQGNIKANVDLFSLPFTISAFISSQQKNSLQDINLYNFSFNSVQFRENLRNRAVKKIKENSVSMVEQKKISRELAKINKILNNPQVKKELRLISRIDSLRQELSNISDLKRREEIKDSIKIYEALEKKGQIYEEIKKKKEYLERILSYQKQYEKFRGIEGKIKSKEEIRDILTNYNVINRAERIGLLFNNFAVGTSYPEYTTLSLHNVPLNGFSMELSYRNTYTAFSYGKLLSPVITQNILNASYKRKIISGGFGYGKKHSTHLYFYILSIKDDTSSIGIRDDIYAYYCKPALNKVMSTELRVNIYKDILYLEAELAGSQTYNDLWLNPAPENIMKDSIAQNFPYPTNWLTDILFQKTDNLTSSTDYAYCIKMNSNFSRTNTKISLETRRIGANYQSLGLPYLLKDIISYKLDLKQKLWKKRLFFSSFIKYNQDNLNNEKPYTSQFTQLGLNFLLSIPGYPQFRVLSTPVIQVSDSQLYYLNILNITTNYNYRIGTTNNTTTISLSSQKSNNNFNDSYLQYHSYYYLLNHIIKLKVPLSLSINGCYIKTEVEDTLKNIFTTGFGITYTYKKWWNNSVACKFYYSPQEDRRTGFFYQSAMNITKNFIYKLRIEKSIYDNYLRSDIYPAYQEYMIQTSLIIKW